MMGCCRFAVHLPHVTRHTSQITRHTSHVTRHTTHVTRHTSHVTRLTSHVTRHTSHLTRHTSHVTRHTPPTSGMAGNATSVLYQTAPCKTRGSLGQPISAMTSTRTGWATCTSTITTQVGFNSTATSTGLGRTSYTTKLMRGANRPLRRLCAEATSGGGLSCLATLYGQRLLF